MIKKIELKKINLLYLKKVFLKCDIKKPNKIASNLKKVPVR